MNNSLGLNLPLLNISNFRREIYLFTRNQNGNQEIIREDSWFPFYFEPTNNPTKIIGYDGVPLRKVFVSEPKEVVKMRSVSSYSSDIKFCINFLIHRVNSIQKAPIKYFFLDIEILAEDMPEKRETKYPISCVSLYNSFTKKIETWFLGDYKNETTMTDSFVDYIHKNRPDIVLSWNIGFDYSYLVGRIKDFAKKISPVGFARLGEEKDIFYPAGISIVDFLRYYKKVQIREGSYALDYIAQKRLGESSWGKTDFSKLSDKVREKNIKDINRLIKLEDKFHIISYFDELRRLTKTQWEDLYYNSRVIEMLLFEEAKKKNIILPNKQRNEIEEETTFQGATRDIEQAGLYENISKCDLSSAYPEMIVNFCLDSKNIKTTKNSNTIEINGIHFEQNKDSLLPSVVKKILILKDELKKQKKMNSDNETIRLKYEAIKAVANSAFGVFGMKFFRLFDDNVAASITFLVRDLLMYIKEKIELELKGLRVIYWDTDAVFINTKENIVDKLNQFIRNWAKEKYGKDSIDLNFEYEGYFTKLFILASCHYFGYINGKEEPEVKGIEAKRSNSSKYEAYFQTELLNKVIQGNNKETIEEWINQEQKQIKTLPLIEISFPCKIANRKYQNYPIFLRAFDNTQKINKNFKVTKGELFYYIFTQNKEVLAFSQDDNAFINRDLIDWNQVIERNIFNKVEKVFSAMKWEFQRNLNQLSLV